MRPVHWIATLANSSNLIWFYSNVRQAIQSNPFLISFSLAFPVSNCWWPSAFISVIFSFWFYLLCFYFWIFQGRMTRRIWWAYRNEWSTYLLNCKAPILWDCNLNYLISYLWTFTYILSRNLTVLVISHFHLLSELEEIQWWLLFYCSIPSHGQCAAIHRSRFQRQEWAVLFDLLLVMWIHLLLELKFDFLRSYLFRVVPIFLMVVFVLWMILLNNLLDNFPL